MTEQRNTAERWFFAVFRRNIAYSWVLLTKRRGVGVVPIANDYWLLVSYGSIVGGLLAWASGQHGGNRYSLAIIGLCVGVWTAAAMMNGRPGEPAKPCEPLRKRAQVRFLPHGALRV